MFRKVPLSGYPSYIGKLRLRRREGSLNKSQQMEESESPRRSKLEERVVACREAFTSRVQEKKDKQGGMC